MSPPAKRILFPFIGQALSAQVLDAALRLARAEDATLIPAYLAVVPLRVSIEAPMPRQCSEALPLLEAIEHRATRQHVSVDSRIEPGRTYRHALQSLLAEEPHDRVVVGVATEGMPGLDPADAAWLLAHGSGEIVVMRPADADHAASTPVTS